MVKLSKRLMKVAERVKKGDIVVDVGTDHGLLPIYLIEKGIAKRAIASDIIEEICTKTKEKIKDLGYLEKIRVIKSDGLLNVKDEEVNDVIIVGMGGMLICEILNKSLAYLEDKTLILGPHRDNDKVRRFLHKVGFKIVSEDIVEDKNNKFYYIITAKKGKDEEYSDFEYEFGKKLVNQFNEKSQEDLEMNKVFEKFLNNQLKKSEDRLKNLEKGKSTKDLIFELNVKIQKIRKILKG